MSRLGAPGVALSTVGNYAVVAGQALRTLILARLMGPATFGVLNVANVAASFTPQVDIGCGRIGEQRASEARGRGDLDLAREELIAAAGARMAPALAFAAALGALATVLGLLGQPRTLIIILLFVGVSAPLQSAWWAVMGWHRVHGQFRRVAHGQIGQVVVWLTVVPLVTWKFGLDGAFVAMAGSFVPPVLIAAPGLPMGRLLRPSWRAFRGLVRPGIPVWLIFATTFAFTNVDQLMAGLLGGAHWLGYLSMATLTASALLAFSDGAAAAAHPRTLEEYAARGRLDVTMPSVTRIMHVVQLGFAVLVPLSWLGMGVVTWLFLKEYAESLPLVALLGVAASFVGTTTASNSALLAVGLHRRVPALFALAALVRAGLAWGASALGLGLIAIGLAGMVAAGVFAVAYLWLVARALGLSGRAAVRFVGDQALGSTVLAALAGLTAYAWTVAGLTGFLTLAGVTLFVAGAIQAAAWFGWRHMRAKASS